MAIVRSLPHAVSFREFYGRPGKPVYHGTCGECALSAAEAAGKASPTTHDAAVNEMLTLAEELIARREADATGATTIAALHDAAVRRGWGIVHYEGFQEPLAFDWHSFLLSDQGAGVNPVIFEVAQAHNLVDTQGSADEAGVHYHFICVVGVDETGYICCDGDNPQAENRTSTYSYATLAAAVPCGMLVLQSQPGADGATAPAPTSPAQGASPVSSPASNPSNTANLGSGMAAYVHAHNITAQCVSGGERFYTPHDSFAAFADGTILYYGPASTPPNTVVSYLGPWVAAALFNDLNAAQGQLGTLSDQLTKANAQIADLKTQLAAAQSTIGGLKADPATQAALNLVAAMKAALSAGNTAPAPSASPAPTSSAS